jgi:hypothetical protein
MILLGTDFMALLTTGAIAKQLNIDRDKVSYAVRKLSIKPVGMAGQVRVFPENAPSRVRKFLDGRKTRRR